ncbi:DUF7536 family protein [Halospeciosus flavus]|uniref:Uncharacterized protein n=1 Tax=Halospeciosus flavus TaxID=3032283 RepID=A0ABD5Z7N1_9EURY|nr:hypothetical protein [Halospeciosus flavus]
MSDRDVEPATDAEPGARPGVANLLDALRVRGLAVQGFAGGAMVAVAVYFVFVVLKGAANPLRYLVLGFVLAVALGLFFTTVLVLVRTYRLVRRLD